MSPTFQAETISRRESGLRRMLATTVASWSMCRRRRGPAAPLVAVDRAELSVASAHSSQIVTPRLERAHVRLAAQEPQELVHDRLRVDLLGRQQRETRA
jgi:hypothetical protein